MATTIWALDPIHSEIHFKVKHMMISTVTGSFQKFAGTAQTEGDDFTTAKVNFTAEVDSIDTNNEQRDGHLKTGDFFDAANHPQISFEGTGMEKTDDENYLLHGNLTMRGTTKPITLNAAFGGIMTDPYGFTRAGFNVSGKISRKEFGVQFTVVSETGGILLGDDVKLEINAELVKG
jgi:polyisoprenoid-binding protein YceI